MKKLKKILSIIIENIQQAEKTYFKDGLLSAEDKENIIKITNGDNFTLPVSHLYFKYKNMKMLDMKVINNFYELLKKYESSFLPIKGFKTISDIKYENVLDILFPLMNREKIIKIIKQLPSIGIRNIKKDTQKERDDMEFSLLRHKFEKFSKDFNDIIITHKSDEWKDKFIKKVFKSSNNSIDDWLDEIKNFDFKSEDKKYILKLIATHEDLTLIAKVNNCIIVKVTGQDGIEEIGCNSLWCFSKSGNIGDWRAYSYKGDNLNIVYVIIDLDLDLYDPEFMVVFINPLEWSVENKDKLVDNNNIAYNFYNVGIKDVEMYLIDTIGIKNAKKYITFDE
jgi:hypothetical protein